MTNLIDELTQRLDSLSNLDPNWKQFVIDHKKVILDEGSIIDITDEDRSKYKFKLDHFLRDKNSSISIDWIVKLINDLDQYEDFTKLSNIIIPNHSSVVTLYRKYQTSFQVR